MTIMFGKENEKENEIIMKRKILLANCANSEQIKSRDKWIFHILQFDDMKTVFATKLIKSNALKA